jgi:phage gpG-like protein
MDFFVSVRAEALIARLAGTPEKMRQAIKVAATRLSIEVQSSVMDSKLTGQVLHVRTGTLRRSINREVQDRPDGVWAIVGTNVRYGAAWERGFSRKVGAGARGGPRTLTGMARERYMAAHPPGIKIEAPRAFLKPTLKEFEQRIRDDLRAAALSAIK